MKRLIKQLKRFHKEEDGAALVEYAVTMLVVILVGAGAFVTLANNTNKTFGNANAVMTNVSACTSSSTTCP